ncbi:peptide/nickel transport system substrate-binding protein [Primorskyibacter sedentarius]|uniref:Peptide/nickel transport system substrate-binding protein n=1 Tax=Primorskyibacter sedentarius TaxID=745311 RepID=A0A4R3J0T9_9RHOB|nr:ABC transporter substrate-binding protein [Primorskyibacter sedentarius]TCS56534.1 peptide/nickel transport system substrate-binding protein [Primorskyibacter sedentarius]
MGHKLSVLALIVAQAAVVAGPALAAPAGEFVIAVHQEPQDLAAQGAYKEINAPGLRNVLEPLIATDPATGEYIPVLATSWERVDDKTVRVTLREGVKFHDSTDMTAEAVAAAVSFVWNPESSFTIQEYAGPGVMSAKATGPLEIEVTSTEPDPMLEFRLTLTGISSAKQIEERPAEHFSHPIGTGPYVFDEWVRGQYWTANANLDWWGLNAEDAYGEATPQFETLRFVFRPEGSARNAMVRTGEAHLATNPSPEDCVAAEDNDGYSCVTGPSDAYLYGRLDQSLHAHPALQDIRVRKAIFHALDYEGIADLIGLASVPQGQLGTPDMLGFNENLSQYEYNPDFARQLVEEARADGVDVDGLVVEVVGRSSTPRVGSVTEVIGFFLDQVGIKTEINVQLPDVFNPRVRIKGYVEEAPRAMMQVHVKQNASGEFGTNMLGNYACPNIDDPSGASRSSVHCNPEFDAKLATALTLSGDERDAALKELVGFLYGQYPIIPLALLDKGYLVGDQYNYTFGVDHRFLAVNVTPKQ